MFTLQKLNIVKIVETEASKSKLISQGFKLIEEITEEVKEEIKKEIKKGKDK